jgi:hypothetical protein
MILPSPGSSDPLDYSADTQSFSSSLIQNEFVPAKAPTSNSILTSSLPAKGTSSFGKVSSLSYKLKSSD